MPDHDAGGHGASPPGPAAGLDVVYLDDGLIALNKPSGLLAVPGRGADKQDCLSSRARQHYPDALVVHRLDMATSGLMLMARSPAMQRALGALFEARQVSKRYVAVVDGRPAPADPGLAPGTDWQLIDLPLAVDWPRRPLRVVDRLNGKPSQTRWCLDTYDPLTHSSRLLLEPLTGRTHQLRVHLQALGHPILGDLLYAPEAVQAKAPRLLLHACALALTHPGTGRPVQLACAPDF
ncbi:MAG: ribosomal large subunit pseudouridine synthase [Polaromonas sp.]|nr:ribosomal large subunit pseudouridine synthase [Polaromonas sp.]